MSEEQEGERAETEVLPEDDGKGGRGGHQPSAMSGNLEAPIHLICRQICELRILIPFYRILASGK